ncbi:hypothetical protein [Aeromicrobium sp. IC_218]|uniref:hypothetical protein n=1 Tax=Aeromicrobium sp. IC_218 TaxID=2545468 RepID=UPI00103B5D17|nr:hypothetical protein [Aeromicrobium sp. IC_218]TCI97764.1 hypothetical protein E0W78_10635 [Aeromicrobium sp. IC_218]
MLRLLFFVGLGIVLGGAVVLVVGPPGAAGWAIPVGLTVAVLSGVLVAVGRGLRGLAVASPEEVEAARAAGRLAVARVDALRQTGTQVNDQPLCEIDLTVAPRSGPAFTTTARLVVPVVEVPQFQPGRTHVVALLTEDGPELAFTEDDPASAAWRTVVVPSRGAAVPDRQPDSHTVVKDGRRRGPLLGMGRRGRPLRLVLYVVVAAVAAALVVLPYRTGLQQTIDALPDGRWHADLRQSDVLGPALDAVAEEVGHRTVSGVTVMEDLLVIEAPVEPGRTPTDRWLYRRGTVQHDGPDTIQPSTPKEQFGLDDVDWGAIGPLLEQARAAADLPDDEDGDGTVRVGRDSDDDVHSATFAQATGPVRLTLTIDGDYGSAFFAADAQGRGLTLTGRG